MANFIYLLLNQSILTRSYTNFLHVACSHVHNPEWQPLTYPWAQWSSLLVHTPSELQGTPTANPTKNTKKVHRNFVLVGFYSRIFSIAVSSD